VECALSFELEQPLTSIEKQQRGKLGLVARRSVLRDAAEILVLIVTIYTFINLAPTRYEVVGNSMQPNFFTGEHIIVNRFAYYFGSPARGDIVVMIDPRDRSVNFIKRMIGLPGETVQIKEGRVYVNGTLLDEPYIRDFCVSGSDGTWPLKGNEYFVLGDNRPVSFDSHMAGLGPVERSMIVGQAWIVYWPLNNVGIISHPTYSPVASNPPSATPTGLVRWTR
jgi:signal peptidase I